MKIEEVINLEAEEKLRRLRWSVYIRYLVLLLVLLLAYVGYQLGAEYDLLGVGIASVVGLLFNAVSSYLYHRGRFPIVWPYLGIVIDMVVITLVVHYTGGIESIFLAVYLLQIVGTNVHFSRLAGPLNFFVGGVGFASLVILESNGIVSHVTPFAFLEGVYLDPSYVTLVSLTVLGLMGMSAYRSGYVIQSLQTVEHRLAGLNDELIATNRALAEANARLRELDRMKTEFISVASHQLRTPLSAVKWVLKMVMDQDLGPVNPEQQALLGKGYQSNERMIALINDLLNVSRIEEGRFEYHFRPTILFDVVQAAVNEVKSVIERKHIVFSFRKPTDFIPELYLDPDKLRLAVQNLIDNALKYTPENGSVDVTVKRREGNVILTVQDTGVGIPASQQDQVFGKFFRGDNVVRMQTEGTGLGLFITKSIIEAHRGRISFASKEGVGTTFTVVLPIAAGAPVVKPRDRFEKFMRSF